MHLRPVRGKLKLVMRMRKNKSENNKPVSPIYAFGLVWLFYSLFFSLHRAADFLLCGLLACLVCFLVKKIIKKDKPVEEKDPEPVPKPEPKPAPKREEEKVNPALDAVIRQGRQSVQRIQALNDDIPDFKISAQLKQIEILTASIIDQVEKKEDKLGQVRQFMNYYLPTTIKLLEQYVQLQDVGLKGENIGTAMTQIEDMLDNVIVAFQKQLDSLFARDVVDITADIQVMERMMASQGLTNQKDF